MRNEKKYLLREAARPLLPASVLSHRKQGFASPMAMWLRGSMRNSVRDYLSPKALAKSGVMAPAHVAEQLDAHDERRSLNDKTIFTTLMFERWWRARQ